MYCRRAWHGPHTSCALLTTSEFSELYLQYPEGSTERLTIEKRHGKANVLRVIAKYQEEQLNRKWMEKETMMYAHSSSSLTYFDRLFAAAVLVAKFML